jgi:hypothetical protein
LKNIKLFNRYLIAAVFSLLTVAVATNAISSHSTGKMQIVAADDSTKGGTGG